jgi:protein TonB
VPVEVAIPPAAGGVGTGGGPAAGSGSGGHGGGAGSGSGAGVGRAVDLRLYCLSCPEPSYPRLARARGWQGATDVELTILADGRVDDASVSRSSGFDVLDRAALEVARRSRFSPPAAAFEPPLRGRLAYRFELRSR